MNADLAVIASGGKQYLVQPGEAVRVEKLNGNVGDEVTFSDVLLIARGGVVAVGAPTVQGARVTGTITRHGRTKKVRGVKFKAKKRQKTTFGHRQHFTDVTIGAIARADVSR